MFGIDGAMAVMQANAGRADARGRCSNRPRAPSRRSRAPGGRRRLKWAQVSRDSIGSGGRISAESGAVAQKGLLQSRTCATTTAALAVCWVTVRRGSRSKRAPSPVVRPQGGPRGPGEVGGDDDFRDFFAIFRFWGLRWSPRRRRNGLRTLRTLSRRSTATLDRYPWPAGQTRADSQKNKC